MYFQRSFLLLGTAKKQPKQIIKIIYLNKNNQINLVKFCSTQLQENKEDNRIAVENIRNFCIIAHVDHGKSTLADRLLELTGTIQKSSENKQVLDRLPVEKERGITVKSVAASMFYNFKGSKYLLNLIDTPGHVDFSNEVNRSLYACQGAVLLIDANQGVQAQTVANFYSAFTLELSVIPVLNKIDLPQADPDGVEKELETLFSFDKSSILRISAKTGEGVTELLDNIIERIPPPNVSRNPPFKALLIDSWFDMHRGAILFIYIAGGEVKVGDQIKSFKNKSTYSVKSTSRLIPEEKPVNILQAGQVGVVACNMRNAKSAYIGDTIYSADTSVEPLRSFDPPKSMVFAGLYPKIPSEFPNLKIAVEKLCLNDPSVTIADEVSPALGSGYRLGFLGLLHLDVFRQRLEQEFEAEVVLTAPSVTYKIKLRKNKNKNEPEIVELKNPVHYPADSKAIEKAYEPIVLVTIITPMTYFQDIMNECFIRRAQDENVIPLDSSRVMLKLTMPLSEIMFDFHDKLKSMSSGYASLDYEDKGFQEVPLKKISILLNGTEVEELTCLVHEKKAREVGLKIVKKLEELLPRQNVQIAIQAAVGSDIVARRTLKAFRKDVIGPLYGGDVTRKMKLLKNQREGKLKMRKFANITIERDTFINVLKAK